MASARGWSGVDGLTDNPYLVQGVDNRNWTLPPAMVLLGGCIVLVVVDRRVTGLSIAVPTGPRCPGPMTARVLVAMACIWAAALTNNLAVATAAAGVVLAATMALGRRYDTSLGQDLFDTSTRPA